MRSDLHVPWGLAAVNEKRGQFVLIKNIVPFSSAMHWKVTRQFDCCRPTFGVGRYPWRPRVNIVPTRSGTSRLSQPFFLFLTDQCGVARAEMVSTVLTRNSVEPID